MYKVMCSLLWCHTEYENPPGPYLFIPFPRPPHSHRPLATSNVLTISVVLPFPAGPTVGIIQYVGFSDWLLIIHI